MEEGIHLPLRASAQVYMLQRSNSYKENLDRASVPPSKKASLSPTYGATHGPRMHPGPTTLTLTGYQTTFEQGG